MIEIGTRCSIKRKKEHLNGFFEMSHKCSQDVNQERFLCGEGNFLLERKMES